VIRTAAKVLLLPGLIKTVLTFAAIFVLIAIFFIGFGQYFVPLLLTGIMIALLYFAGLIRRMPPWQTLLVILLTFGMGFFIQRISVLRMSTAEGQFSFSATPDLWLSIIVLSSIVIALGFLLALAMKRKSKRR
jgi:hypothetical protein